MTTDLTGKLLIAAPAIGDDRFSRSVILVCAHEDEYAMGIILNKPVEEITLPVLLEQLNVETHRDVAGQFILDGGPVGEDRGFVLHSDDYNCEGATMDVADGVCLTATRSALHALASETPPRKAILALGYSGWGEGQLEFELAENAWIVGDPSEDIIFSADHASKWSQALDKLGVDSGRLQSSSGRA